jgi:hypothetical protein
MELDQHTIQTLSCDISVRPKDAAGIAEMCPFVKSTELINDQLAIIFDVAVNKAIESFVAAEKTCCTSLEWNITTVAGQIKLTIGGTPEQLTVVQSWFQSA